MQIRYHKRFEKHFKNLPSAVRAKVVSTLQLLAQNPTDPRLKNHALKGRLAGLRAIAVTGNIRIIFEARDEYESVTILDVGTHNQVYR